MSCAFSVRHEVAVVVGCEADVETVEGAIGDRQIENNVAAGARCKADVETLQVTVGGGHVKHLHLREGGQVESSDLPEMSAKRRGIGLAGYYWLTELTFEPWALR